MLQVQVLSGATLREHVMNKTEKEEKAGSTRFTTSGPSPCPFCGEEGGSAFGPNIIENSLGSYSVECACGGSNGLWSTKERAVQKWNQRPFRRD